jgi:hypothetical protein
MSTMTSGWKAELIQTCNCVSTGEEPDDTAALAFVVREILRALPGEDAVERLEAENAKLRFRCDQAAAMLERLADELEGARAALNAAALPVENGDG